MTQDPSAPASRKARDRSSKRKSRNISKNLPLHDLSNEDRTELIRSSPTYLRADKDLDFLTRDELRPSRLQLEFLKPELIFQDTGINSAIVVFGGTRIIESEEAEKKIQIARKALEKNPDDPSLRQRLYQAERVLAKGHYYDIAREFGQIVGRSGGSPEDCRLVIVTGGGPGLMEAANRGAFDAGAKSVGLNITLPREQQPNPYITPELCFQFRYFALRKMHFLHRAKALVVFPGGYGTLDEMFEVLTLIQTEKVNPLPIVLVGEEYWRHVIDFQYMSDEGTIDPKDISLFWYAETAQEIWETIIAWYSKTGRSIFSIEEREL